MPESHDTVILVRAVLFAMLRCKRLSENGSNRIAAILQLLGFQ
jgi:hypothetical protein